MIDLYVVPLVHKEGKTAWTLMDAAGGIPPIRLGARFLLRDLYPGRAAIPGESPCRCVGDKVTKTIVNTGPQKYPGCSASAFAAVARRQATICPRELPSGNRARNNASTAR